MNSNNKMEIKAIILNVLKSEGFNGAKIILFGSRAKGDFKIDSDWDFLVILKDNLVREQKLNLAYKIRRKLADIHIPCDVIVRSEEEVEKRKEVIGSVIRSAIKTGVTL
jgi:predicted nucleotidyltransferase